MKKENCLFNFYGEKFLKGHSNVTKKKKIPCLWTYKENGIYLDGIKKFIWFENLVVQACITWPKKEILNLVIITLKWFPSEISKA